MSEPVSRVQSSITEARVERVSKVKREIPGQYEGAPPRSAETKVRHAPDVRRFYVEKDENGVFHVNIRKEEWGKFKSYELDKFNKALDKSVNAINKKMVSERRELRFELREEAGIYQVTVLDTTRDLRDPQRIVRQIPPEETINFIENIRETTGLLLDIEL